MSEPNVIPDSFYSAITEKLPSGAKIPASISSGDGASKIALPFALGYEMPNLSRTLAHVAWMAILLGLIIEILLLAVAASFDTWIEGRAALADLTQKVSWSVIVCIGLALARGATRMFAHSARAMTVGAVGLLTAPMAFAIARSLHESVQEVLFIKIFQAGAGLPVPMALIKGLEYGCLGVVLVWVSKQRRGKALAHAGAGVVVSVVFGALLIGVTAWGAVSPMSLGTVLPSAVNELIHPMGCSLALYSAEILGRMQIVQDSISG